MIMDAGIAGQLAAKAKAANDVEEAEQQQQLCDELREYANMLVEIEGRFEQLEPTQPVAFFRNVCYNTGKQNYL